MKLVLEGSKTERHVEPEPNNYNRLFIIIGLIVLVTLALSIKNLQEGVFSWKSTMRYFMAGFFLVFSGFKLMDIRGFAEGYSTYDLLAKKIFQYGYIYPFIELAFGLAFLASFQVMNVTIIEIIIMIFSGAGVARSMLRKQKIQCACLGTIIKLPLGTVTLVEDFGMAIMGILLLLI